METVFRKEIKYLISRREAMILQQKLDGIMERDIHGENGRYFIRSQYYDSIDDQDLWDNLDGMYEKRKIRLRIYSLNDLSAKLEFKCKNGSDGVKYSIPVSREQALRMEQGDASFLLEYETELAMRLYLRITQGCYRPKTIIDYQRLAFAYPAGDVRITFDTDIRGSLYPYGLFEEVAEDGTKIMSVNLLIDNEDAPVIWRGPVIAGAVKQFWTDVVWGELDYLFVDMPPGTGDVPLTVFQSLPVDGIVIVTSPQELVQLIVKKAYNMANAMNIPIAGIVENYSYLKCPDCGKEIRLFGESHIDEAAAELHTKVLAKMPLDPAYAKAADEGRFYEMDNPYLDQAAEEILAM